MSSLIYFVRHGETEWNRQQRIQGSTDIPLNDTGRAQALAAAARLSDSAPDLIVASPLMRAFETATIIGDSLGLNGPTADPALVERNYGEAEGMNYRQIEDRFPDRALIRGHESHERLAARSLGALHRLARSHDGASMVVVAHGGVIRAVLGEIDQEGTYGAIRNGSIHSLSFSGDQFSLLGFDEVTPRQPARS
ncbi:MAG: histidine phosphatase family protein [Rhodoglobus sp.]